MTLLCWETSHSSVPRQPGGQEQSSELNSHSRGDGDTHVLLQYATCFREAAEDAGKGCVGTLHTLVVEDCLRYEGAI